MEPVVLCFAGRIASGKSSLSAAIANRLSLPRASFGDYVRHVAEYVGLDANERTILQDLGNFLVRYPKAFCTKVLEQGGYQPNYGLVIDGIRHVEILDELRQLVAPARVILIFVVADDAAIERRVRDRHKPIGDIHVLEQHATESQVKGILSDIADIYITNNDSRSLESVSEELLLVLRKYSPH